MSMLAVSRRVVQRRSASVVLAVALLLVVGVSAAFAANLSGDGVLVGTSGNDNLTALNASGDMIWGLGGNDTLNAGNGNNDVVDGGGSCPPGLKSGVYPQLPAGEYCEHGPVAPCGVDNMSIGAGSNDVIYGNCGQNSIAGNGGSYTVYGYGTNDNISLSGSGNDVVYVYAPGNINVGSGTNVVYDNYGASPNINCGSSKTMVYAPSSSGIQNPCKWVYKAQQSTPAGAEVKLTDKTKISKSATTHKTEKSKKSR
jgi:hypothetical protein